MTDAGETVTSFVAGTVTAYPHRAYPVVDLDGRLAGPATLDARAACRAARRGGVRLIDLAVPAGAGPDPAHGRAAGPVLT